MQADISNPSGAMVTVAAMAKIVVMAMALKILIALAAEKNAPPWMTVKITIETTSAITAAQSIRKRPALFFLSN